MNNSFSLIALDLRRLQEKNIRKNLKPQVYYFDKRYKVKNGIVLYKAKQTDAIIDTLYGENIHVQAIVGKNGSGKSSLLDIIYQVVNNLSFSLLAKSQNSSLYNVEDLEADLYYVMDDECYCIYCYNHAVRWSKQKINSDFQSKIIYDSYSSHYVFDKSLLVNRCKELFYTIVTNYSPHALIPDEYKDAKVERFVNDVLTEQDDTSWLPSLFHKNDGYLTPITLVPYRSNNGSIDMAKELRLCTYRLSSVFLYYHYWNKVKSETEGVIDSYSLHDIRYIFNAKHAEEKFRIYAGSDKMLSQVTKKKIGNTILTNLDLYDPDLLAHDDIYNFGCMYLLAKIYTIVSTYPSYKTYIDMFFDQDSNNGRLSVKNPILSPMPNIDFKTRLKDLIDRIENIDKTHITIKFRQTLSLLRYIKGCKHKDVDCSWLSEDFGYKEYVEQIHEISSIQTIENVQALLPPPIFKADILLDKKVEEIEGNKFKNEHTEIKLSKLSSGERQLLYVLSTYIYHVFNLISNSRDIERISYRNICLIMDEVEICFHPDYQRQFINRLVTTLRDMQLNQVCSFYILLATHSPFMLSDIPQQNILYLENGENVSKDIDVKPFCANVNDILYQSFFLKDGFSGALATNSVKEFMNYLETDNDATWNQDKADIYIEDIIGDPILRDVLRAMYNCKFNK